MKKDEWARYVAGMVEKKHAYRFLLGKPEGTEQLRKT
jgi:hypothetical protein